MSRSTRALRSSPIIAAWMERRCDASWLRSKVALYFGAGLRSDAFAAARFRGLAACSSSAVAIIPRLRMHGVEFQARHVVAWSGLFLFVHHAPAPPRPDANAAGLMAV